MGTSYEYYFLIGGLLVLATDLLVLGIMSPVLVSMGLSMFITGLGVSIFDLDTIGASVQFLCVSTVFMLYPLWLICKYLLNRKGAGSLVSTPYEGEQFVLTKDLNLGVPKEMDYLGCSWTVHLTPPQTLSGVEASITQLKKGELVTIVRSGVGELWVLASSSS